MYDVITIGDCMGDTFLFPALSEMEKPVENDEINVKENYEKYLVFGLGDKITIEDAVNAYGGTAYNVAVGLRRLGLKTCLASARGDDLLGAEIEKEIKKEKVDLCIKVYRGKKSSFSVIVSYKGERTIFVFHGFGPEDLKMPADFSTGWVYLGPMADGYEKLFAEIVNLKIKKDFKVALNPGSVQIEKGLHSFGGLLKIIDVIFLNREEANQISALRGVQTVKVVAEEIQAQGPKQVVITAGKEGAYSFDGENFLKVGPYPGHRLEATGAGDGFASGYLAAIIEGEEEQAALKWGVTNAASVIEKIGAQEGLLGKNTIKRRVKEYRWPADTLRFS